MIADSKRRSSRHSTPGRCRRLRVESPRTRPVCHRPWPPVRSGSRRELRCPHISASVPSPGYSIETTGSPTEAAIATRPIRRMTPTHISSHGMHLVSIHYNPCDCASPFWGTRTSTSWEDTHSRCRKPSPAASCDRSTTRRMQGARSGRRRLNPTFCSDDCRPPTDRWHPICQPLSVAPSGPSHSGHPGDRRSRRGRSSVASSEQVGRRRARWESRRPSSPVPSS